MSSRTHYDALGVARTATAAQIRAAYRATARDHHPDAGGDPARMQEINAAWHVLGDPARRAAYDRWLAAGEAAAAPTGGDAGAAEDAWMPAPGGGLSPEDWADLADARPIGQSMVLEGWWAILPPATLVAAIGLLVGGFVFLSPTLLAMSAGGFLFAVGLFVLAPLRAMTKR